LALLVLAGSLRVESAAAHDRANHPLRELVRLQGYRAPAPADARVQGETTLAVLGRQVPFATVEWRVFAFAASRDERPPALPAALTLQGERGLLRRVSSARADQRLTLLAEHRPGSSDLFLLAVDLCPP
jgi:hypothetical protein